MSVSQREFFGISPLFDGPVHLAKAATDTPRGRSRVVNLCRGRGHRATASSAPAFSDHVGAGPTRSLQNDRPHDQEKNAVTKGETIDAIASKCGQSKAVVEKVLDGFVEHVHGALKKGGEVSLPGLGNWKVNKRAARKGRNPKTGEQIKIAAKCVPKFSAAGALKAACAK